VTVGAWIWASSAGPAALPQVGDNPADVVTVGTSPAFFAQTVAVPTDTMRLAAGLSAMPDAADAGRTVYYDGLVLVDGAEPAGPQPVFDGAGGLATGTWAGQPFTNLIRNASAEQAGPWIRPWAEDLFRRVAGSYLSPSALVGALADFDRNRAIYRATAGLLVESFWARFSWGQIGLPSPWYALAAVFTIVGALAAAIRLARSRARRSESWNLAVAWLALALLASWGTVSVRGLFSAVDAEVALPVARYAFPVIIPTLLFLAAGWQAVFVGPGFWAAPGRWATPRDWLAAVPLAFFLALDVVSVWAIVQVYRQV
jgi:hypothetical protein